MKRNILGSLVAVLMCGMLACSCSRKEATANYDVIPLPQQVTPAEGEDFVLNASTVIAVPEADTVLRKDAELLVGYLTTLTGHAPEIVTAAPESNVIELSLGNENPNPEAYTLTVAKDKITICGTTAAGAFYGIQTLRKSIPEASEKQDVKFPPVTISDYPRFAYRGAHLDVSRHMFTLDSVKTFIDMLALHNINRFHWHITDDQGWRIEIKSRPLLTELGSKRNGTCVGHDFDTSDSIPYGGFYTQEEAREIVKYAADRHITVIPEIDMPGHMLGALRAYPELGCTGGPYEVWQRWGVSEDVLCAGNDSVLTFIDDVLGEIVDIFPSEYIHVGGDECPKIRWQECAKCQAKAKALGLKEGPKGTVEEQLQSYLIHHASDFLTSRGRKMIGWDETLEGGLAPGAIVMSWRGEEGAKAAAREGHDAIMTPTNYMYFDYYQTLDREGEPDAIGGYVPVEKVYSFNPTPDDLTDEEKAHIIGVQANLWTEYIPTFSGVQYAELPRMAALSEVQWTAADKRDYESFTKRIPQLAAHYKANGYRYATHIFNVNGKLTPNPEGHCMDITFSTVDDAPVYYTTDGSVPTESSAKYEGPFSVDSTCVIKAVAVRPDGNSRVFTDSVSFNKATCRSITLASQPHSRYADEGAQALVNGKFGSDSFTAGNWLGFEGNAMDATIDLGEPVEVSTVTVRCLIEPDSWIFDATDITVELSADGKTFTTVASETYPVDGPGTRDIRLHKFNFAAQSARFVRVKAGCVMEIPSWDSRGKGKPGFL
ncbi:family 20 glycosylhydrolase, partial [uncultured Duncaniella sp.]|uniref:glycoside hydrolase family 20 protein n=1 Tax=uncultured Duncaniella sp. TaxID=2768039 RepID=UPI00265AA4DF